MIFVDTGYFIAILNPRDQLHARAVAWSLALHERLLVSEYVVWETINYFSMPIDRPKVHAWVDHIRSEAGCEWIDAAPVLLNAALDMHRRRPDKQWSLTDCASFVIMRERSISAALAWDQHFEQAGYQALLRRDPPRGEP
jgi:predicted nucleic acid-binding protein